MGNENWDKEEKNKRWRSQKRIRLIRLENNKNVEKSTDFVKKQIKNDVCFDFLIYFLRTSFKR